MKNSSNDPSGNEKVHQSVSNSQSNLLEDRTAFNDVIEHGDIVQNFQSPKRIEQMPKWYRTPYKILTIIALLGFASTTIYQIIQLFIAMGSE